MVGLGYLAPGLGCNPITIWRQGWVRKLLHRVSAQLGCWGWKAVSIAATNEGNTEGKEDEGDEGRAQQQQWWA